MILRNLYVRLTSKSFCINIKLMGLFWIKLLTLLICFVMAGFLIIYLATAGTRYVTPNNYNSSTVKQPEAPPAKSEGIAPETTYENPFYKESQYVNPFSDYKNPFDK